MENKYKKIDPWKLIEEALLIAPTFAIYKTSETFFSIAMEKIFPNGRWGRYSRSSKIVKKNFKLKILRSLIQLPTMFDLNEKELKIACHIINSPWIKDDVLKTENELRKKVVEYTTPEYFKLITKYLDPLKDDDIYHLKLSFYPPIVDNENISLKEFNEKKLRKEWVEKLTNILTLEHVRCLDYPKTIIRQKREELHAEKLYSNASLYFSTIYSSLISTQNLSKEFDDLTKNIFEDKDNIYKTAVDANYLNDKSSYGGPYHRLFDDSHSLGKMWGKIKDAKGDDSRIEEIIAWANEAAKDVQTTMGLPIISMKKETFDELSNFLSPIGIEKRDLYDMFTYNIQEVLSVAFLGITSILPSIKKDKKKLNTIKGFMLAAGAYGNPLALIFLLVNLVISIIKNDVGQFKKDLMSKETVAGFTISTIIKFSVDYLGAKAILTIFVILISLILTLYFFKKNNKKIKVNKLKIEFIKEIENLKESSKKLLEKQKIKPLP